MTREKTEGPEVYEAGTLRPTFLPNQSSKNPAEAEKITATLEERRASVGALGAEEAAWAGRHERLQGALSRARTESARIREQLAAAESRERDAQIALANAQGNHDAAVIGHERFLRGTAPALIDQVLVYLRDQLEGLRRRGMVQVTERYGLRSPLTLRRPRTTFSNVESIEARRVAIMAALTTWEGYRLAAIDPAELRARAEALPASLPAVDGTIEAPIEPILTPAEARALDWRMAEQQEAKR